ncbi:hypothetical protein FH972_020967 [Carpinus fangiana]|uniref:Ribosome biogenesis protein SLX9 n=1 Tax=Carpinus fangiana TaxID=176857 RepID=A0A5N6KNC5_9ROSI|nr:hypothetical protein FH972_020967 [Carpinus fangiana]
MAPRRSVTRPRQRSKATPTTSSMSTVAATTPKFNPHRSGTSPSSLDLASNKRDRRQIKHSLLLSRASSSSDRRTSGISKSSARRRLRSTNSRKKERLAADLGSLADALDDAADESVPGEATGTGSSSRVAQARALLTSTKSIKSKGGMQKRKAAIAAVERERMAQNMAVLAGSRGQGPDTGADAARAEKWAALRRHITATSSGGAGT